MILKDLLNDILFPRFHVKNDEDGGGCGRGAEAYSALVAASIRAVQPFGSLALSFAPLSRRAAAMSPCLLWTAFMRGALPSLSVASIFATMSIR